MLGRRSPRRNFPLLLWVEAGPEMAGSRSPVKATGFGPVRPELCRGGAAVWIERGAELPDASGTRIRLRRGSRSDRCPSRSPRGPVPGPAGPEQLAGADPWIEDSQTGLKPDPVDQRPATGPGSNTGPGLTGNRIGLSVPLKADRGGRRNGLRGGLAGSLKAAPSYLPEEWPPTRNFRRFEGLRLRIRQSRCDGRKVALGHDRSRPVHSCTWCSCHFGCRGKEIAAYPQSERPGRFGIRPPSRSAASNRRRLAGSSCGLLQRVAIGPASRPFRRPGRQLLSPEEVRPEGKR